MSELSEVDPYGLLLEWVQWWKNNPEAPAKMPDALHVRTAMALLVHAQVVGGDLALAELVGDGAAFMSAPQPQQPAP